MSRTRIIYTDYCICDEEYSSWLDRGMLGDTRLCPKHGACPCIKKKDIKYGEQKDLHRFIELRRRNYYKIV